MHYSPYTIYCIPDSICQNIRILMFLWSFGALGSGPPSGAAFTAVASEKQLEATLTLALQVYPGASNIPK